MAGMTKEPDRALWGHQQPAGGLLKIKRLHKCQGPGNVGEAFQTSLVYIGPAAKLVKYCIQIIQAFRLHTKGRHLISHL